MEDGRGSRTVREQPTTVLQPRLRIHRLQAHPPAHLAPLGKQRRLHHPHRSVHPIWPLRHLTPPPAGQPRSLRTTRSPSEPPHALRSVIQSTRRTAPFRRSMRQTRPNLLSLKNYKKFSLIGEFFVSIQKHANMLLYLYTKLKYMLLPSHKFLK